MNGIPALDEHGVLSEVVRTIVPPLPVPKATRIAVVACGVKQHFPWGKACRSYDRAVGDIEAALPTGLFEIIRSPEPFEAPAPLLTFLDGALRDGVDAVVLYHAAYTAGELGSQLGRWLLDHPVPLLSWSHPDPHTGGNIEFNSLCCQNFLLNMFSRLGVAYTWIHGEPDGSMHEAIGAFSRTARARARLRHGKLLHVGGSRVPRLLRWGDR